MSVTDKAIIETGYAANSETTQYTAATGVRTTILKFTGTNVTGSAATLTVRLVPSGGTAGASNAIVLTKSIEAGGSYTFPELIGHTLNSGDFISTLCGTASAIVIRATGREVS
jgi:hypothetical protein